MYTCTNHFVLQLKAETLGAFLKDFFFGLCVGKALNSTS